MLSQWAVSMSSSFKILYVVSAQRIHEPKLTLEKRLHVDIFALGGKNKKKYKNMRNERSFRASHDVLRCP